MALQLSVPRLPTAAANLVAGSCLEAHSMYHPPKTNMTNGKFQPFEDVSAITNGDFSNVMFWFQGCILYTIQN